METALLHLSSSSYLAVYLLTVLHMLRIQQASDLKHRATSDCKVPTTANTQRRFKPRSGQIRPDPFRSAQFLLDPVRSVQIRPALPRSAQIRPDPPRSAQILLLGRSGAPKTASLNPPYIAWGESIKRCFSIPYCSATLGHPKPPA